MGHLKRSPKNPPWQCCSSWELRPRSPGGRSRAQRGSQRSSPASLSQTAKRRCSPASNSQSSEGWSSSSTRRSVISPCLEAPSPSTTHGQSLDYGSDAWHEVFTAGRQTIESINAYLKDESKEHLGAPGRRRVRGIAAAQVFASRLAAAANIRKIQKFYCEAFITRQGRIGVPVKSPAPRKRYTSRRSRSVQHSTPRHGAKPPDDSLTTMI